jgi:hypothetical protein
MFIGLSLALTRAGTPGEAWKGILDLYPAAAAASLCSTDLRLLTKDYKGPIVQVVRDVVEGGSVSSLTCTGATATVNFTAPHTFVTGELCEVSGATPTPSVYNTIASVTVLSATSISYPLASVPTSNASGTIIVNKAKDIYPTARPAHTFVGVADVKNRWVDTATITAFVGSGNGSISKRYSQIGTNHMTQSDRTRRPSIVKAGVLSAVNGRPVLSWDGVDDMMNFNTPITGVRSVVVAHAWAGSTGTRSFYGGGDWLGFVNGTKLFWPDALSSPSIRGGTGSVNGVSTSPAVMTRFTAPTVLSINTTGPVTINDVATSNDQFWGWRSAEHIFSTVLPPDTLHAFALASCAAYGIAVA